MPTTVKDDIENRAVAASVSNMVFDGANINVPHCVVSEPDLFKLGQSYRLIDAAHTGGVSAKLMSKPGGGMRTAVFQQN